MPLAASENSLLRIACFGTKVSACSAMVFHSSLALLQPGNLAVCASLQFGHLVRVGVSLGFIWHVFFSWFLPQNPQQGAREHLRVVCPYLEHFEQIMSVG